jgi:hypothetical protein
MYLLSSASIFEALVRTPEHMPRQVTMELGVSLVGRAIVKVPGAEILHNPTPGILLPILHCTLSDTRH